MYSYKIVKIESGFVMLMKDLSVNLLLSRAKEYM